MLNGAFQATVGEKLVTICFDFYFNYEFSIEYLDFVVSYEVLLCCTVYADRIWVVTDIPL